MSTEKKTVDDPVSAEILKRFQQLATLRSQLAEQYVDLASEQIRIQVAIRQVDQDRTKMFEKELLDRGLNPSLPIEIDSQTGKIDVKTPPVTPV